MSFENPTVKGVGVAELGGPRAREYQAEDNSPPLMSKPRTGLRVITKPSQPVKAGPLARRAQFDRIDAPPLGNLPRTRFDAEIATGPTRVGGDKPARTVRHLPKPPQGPKRGVIAEPGLHTVGEAAPEEPAPAVRSIKEQEPSEPSPRAQALAESERRPPAVKTFSAEHDAFGAAWKGKIK